MTSNDIREKFLNFFKKRDHAILPSVSLITKDEKRATNSTLFNTAGMQPLVPYFMGQEHPKGKRLASSQKCIRTIDIDKVGDKTHLTFFEMLGNWSIGDYFKKEAINWSYEFLTSKNEGLGLDPQKIYVTVFAGNKLAEKDLESFEIWQKYIPKERIYFLEENWWDAGENGPGGIDTEIFYNITEDDLGNMSHEEFVKADNEQKIVEIWNNVFMEYEKKDNKIIGKLPRNIVDTGAGLERILTIVNKKESIYETDSFSEIIKKISEKSTKYEERSSYIIADHLKSSVMLISDGVSPSNTDRGYILRRLIRRAIRHADKIELPHNFLITLVPEVKKLYENTYKNIEVESIQKQIEEEETKFRKTLEKGLSELKKIKEKKETISGKDAFKLFSTFGFPIELTQELAEEQGSKINLEDFRKEMETHQELSRTASEGKFKGGLEKYGEIETKYHTATHLLQQALRDVLGKHVFQKGSNINSSRLRFDFSHPEKLTDLEKDQIEKIVNEKIKESLPVKKISMSKEDALKTGALHLFDQKYGDEITLYFIGEDLKNAYSKEFCGGPHVDNTSKLGTFKIKKEEASSSGVRRIKATLS